MKKLLTVLFIFCNLSLFCQSFVQFDSQYGQISFNYNPNECTLVLKEIQDSSLLIGLPFDLRRLSNSTFVVYAPLDSAANFISDSVLLYPSLLDDSDQSYYITNEIILKFKNGISPTVIAALEDSFNLIETETSNYFKVYRCDDPVAVRQAIYNTGHVKYCEPNFFFQLQLASHTPNDPYFEHQFYLSNTGQTLNDGLIGSPLQDIKATEAWDLTTGHDQIKIAIVDQGGIEIGHPDLPEYKIERSPMFLNTLPYLPGDDLSVTAHGQACAGIIGAEIDNNEGITGICPRGTLLPLGMSSNNFVTKSSDFAMIFYWITDPSASNRPKVVSCSFVAPTDSPYEDAVASGIETGVLFCFAAGNTAQHSNGCDGATSYSGVHELSNVLIVAASTAQGNAADYSGFGTWVDIAAPSASDVACPQSLCGNFPPLPQELPNIWTTDIMGPLGFNSNSSNASNGCLPPGTEQVPADNNNYTGRFYGTSAATPQVAAVAALMKSANSCIGYQEIIDILTSTADQTGVDISGIPYNYNHDPLRPGHSVELGYGRLDAFEAVSEALALGGFDFEIEILNYICEEDDNGVISVHFPNGNANDYELFLEWPVYVGFEELPSVQINAEQPVTIPNHGARPYLLRVVHATTGCNSSRQYWMDIENTLELTTSVNLDCFPAQICAQLEGGQGPYTYFWNDQNGASCIDINQNTSLTLNVEDQEGCSISSDLAVEVPAFFEMMDDISTSSECLFIAHSPIQFSNPIAIEEALLEWNFGDGATATGQNVEHTYSTAGEFVVTLTITLPDCEPTLVEETVIIDSFDHPSNVTISNQSEANALLLNNSTFGGDIIFLANTAVYTLNDLTLYLSPSSDIIINEGASVRFNRCTLTSCSSWNGIDVRANSSNDISEGRLVFDSSMGFGVSTLEYARIAIETRDSRPNADNMATFMLRVGFINCNRTIFRNNLSSLLISNGKPASPPAAVGFNLCTFTINDELQDHFMDDLGDYNQFRSHVRMIRIRDYNFRGCVFSNEMTSNTSVGNWRNRGVGIHASQSRFRIQELASTQVGVTHNGRFEGFDRGIATSKGISSLTITNQVFERNHIGVSLIGATGSRVFKNTFRIGERTNISFLDEQETYGTFPGNDFGLTNSNAISYEGLVVYKGDIIEIAENVFEGITPTNGGISDDFYRVGVRIRETLTTNMIVNKNSFTSLHFGALANGDNSSGEGANGLRFLCNTLNNPLGIDFTNTDFLYDASTIGEDAHVAVHQKVPESDENEVELSAGNVFTQAPDNPNTSYQWHNEGVQITEYKHNGSPTQIPTENLGFANNALQLAQQENPCEPKYNSSHIIKSTSVIAGMIAQGETFRLSADNLRYLYLLTLDGGDTESLQQFVENTWGAQVWTTKEELLNISPFVTIEVLQKVVDNTGVYPHAIAFELLLANPSALIVPSFVNHLSTKQDPLPEALLDILLTMASPTSSARSAMEKTLGDERTRQHNALDEAFWSMLEYDDDTYGILDYIGVLEKMNTFNSECAIIELLMQEGSWNDALVRTVNLPNRVKLTKATKREYDVLLPWIQLQVSAHLAGRDTENLLPVEIQETQAIAQKFDTYASVQALELLNSLEENHFFVPPAYGRIGTTRSLRIEKSSPSDSFITLFPNPADYLLELQLKQPLPIHQTCTLVILDAMGRRVIQQTIAPHQMLYAIDISALANGFYVLQIIHPQLKLNIHEKFEVAR